MMWHNSRGKHISLDAHVLPPIFSPSLTLCVCYSRWVIYFSPHQFTFIHRCILLNVSAYVTHCLVAGVSVRMPVIKIHSENESVLVNVVYEAHETTAMTPKKKKKKKKKPLMVPGDVVEHLLSSGKIREGRKKWGI